MESTKDLERISEMRRKLESLGATEEDIKKLWMIALETADKIIKES